MSHKMLKQYIVIVPVLGHFLLIGEIFIYRTLYYYKEIY